MVKKRITKILSTTEVIILLKGILRVDFYNQKQKYLFSKILKKKSIILLVHGGHGFKVIKDVEMIEVKQGPYFISKDKVKFDVKKARAKILRKLSNLKFKKLQAENINCIKPVLFEFNNNGFMSGLTDNYLRVNVFDSKSMNIKKNNFISNVRLLKPQSDVILGELLHD